MGLNSRINIFAILFLLTFFAHGASIALPSKNIPKTNLNIVDALEFNNTFLNFKSVEEQKPIPSIGMTSKSITIAIISESKKIVPKTPKQKVILKEITDLANANLKNNKLETNKNFEKKFSKSSERINNEFPNTALAILCYYKLLIIDFEVRNFTGYYLISEKLLNALKVFQKQNKAFARDFVTRTYLFRAYTSLTLAANKVTTPFPVIYPQLADAPLWQIAKADSKMALKSYGMPNGKVDRFFGNIIAVDKSIDAWTLSFIEEPNLDRINKKINNLVDFDEKSFGEISENHDCPEGVTIGIDYKAVQAAGRKLPWGVAQITVDIEGSTIKNARFNAVLPNTSFKPYVEESLRSAKPNFPKDVSADCLKDYSATIVLVTRPKKELKR